MIKYEDMTPEEREKYDRGEGVMRKVSEPGDPPNLLRFIWTQKMYCGQSYEEWKAENG